MTVVTITPSYSEVLLTGATPTITITSEGTAGVGIPAGGTINQVLAKASSSNYDTYWTSAGGGVSDGDKGDITVSGGGSVWTIDNAVVTLAKLANMATGSLFYRKTAGSGAPEVNTLTTLKTDLGLTGTNSGDQTITLTGAVTGSGTGSFLTTLAAGIVSLANMANVATGTVFYRKTAGSGAPEVQTLATLKTDLGLTGTNSGDQTSIVGITGTLAQFNTAVTDADFARIDASQTFSGTQTFSGPAVFNGLTTFTDWNFSDGVDPTKIGQFDISGNTTGTTRTYTLPNSNGTVALTSDLTSGYQPLDADLTAIAALSGTNNIYYRSAANTWSSVTIGSNLTFSGGALSASGGGVTDGDKGDIVVSGTGTVWSIDYTAVNATIAPVWGNITSKPTTISGYGITDAVTLTGSQTITGVKTFPETIRTGLTTDPASPVDGTEWYDSQIMTRKKQIGGRTKDVFADLFNSGAMAWKAQVASGGFNVLSLATPTAVGNATAASIATTNKHTMYPRSDALITVASTSAIAGWRDIAGRVTVGGASSDIGGFRFSMIWGPATGVATSTTRGVAGLMANTGGPTDVEPSTNLVSCAVMGWDTADTNIQMMFNDASGTCTKVDLGSSFARPNTDRTSVYKLEMYSPKGTTQSVKWRVTDMVSGAVATGTASTDLPTTTTLLLPKVYMSVGGTSSVIGVALMSMYLDPLL